MGDARPTFADDDLIGASSASGSTTSGDKSRIISRLTTDFVLRSLSLLSTVYGDNLLRALIVASVISSNTGHLNLRGGSDGKYEGMDQLPPDSERRPVSVLALSKSLSLPFETTRRYINGLIADGICKRVKGGVIVPSAVIEAPENVHAILANMANARRFVREVRRAGLDVD